MSEAETGSRVPILQRHKRRDSTDPGMFSTRRSFEAVVGSLVKPGEVAGYYIDFAFKAPTADWPPDWLAPLAQRFHVATAQWGLGAYERFLHGEGDRWLAGAIAAADHLVDEQAPNGTWPHLVEMPHTYRLRPPWVSGMAQGEGASLLVRVHAETGEDRYAEAALRALLSFRRPVSEGGVRAKLAGGPFYEEYPTEPPSLVLNGGIFALWGAYDVGVGLADQGSMREFETGLDALAAGIDRYDTGYWSRYDLYPHPIPNIASSAYHTLHVNQLEAMELIAPRQAIAAAADRFRRYADDRLGAARAFTVKVAFRLLVPRNPVLAHRMPWSRG